MSTNFTEQISRRFPGDCQEGFQEKSRTCCIASACYVMYRIYWNSLPEDVRANGVDLHQCSVGSDVEAPQASSGRDAKVVGGDGEEAGYFSDFEYGSVNQPLGSLVSFPPLPFPPLVFPHSPFLRSRAPPFLSEEEGREEDNTWEDTYGCRAFHYACPAVWNSLPDELRNLDSFDSFARFLKTILFSRY